MDDLFDIAPDPDGIQVAVFNIKFEMEPAEARRLGQRFIDAAEETENLRQHMSTEQFA